MISALNSQTVGAPSSLPATTTAGTTVGATSSTPAAVRSISPQAELLGKLSALKESDPEQFQATLSKMADELRASAKEQSGAAAQRLNGLADKVSEAARTGDLSALQADAGGASGKPAGGRPAGPPPGPPPGGGGAKSASKSSSAEGASDPADTDGDGTVSAAEKAIYALTHSASSDSVAASSDAS